MKKIFFPLLCLAAFISWHIPVGASQDIRVCALQGTTGLTVLELYNNDKVPLSIKGYTINPEILKNTDLLVARLVAGETDFALLPTNIAAMLYNKGVPIKIAAITNWGVNYLVGMNQTVQIWSDLKGKTVVMPSKGATPDILFRYFLKKAGLSENDLTLQYVNTAIEAAQLIIAGRNSLAVLPEPWVSEVLGRNKEVKILLDFQREWKKIHGKNRSYPQSCMVITKSFLQKNPSATAKFLSVISHSTTWVIKNPGKASNLAGQLLGISPEAAVKAIPRCNLDASPISTVKQETEDFLKLLEETESASIGGKLPDAEFYSQI